MFAARRVFRVNRVNRVERVERGSLKPERGAAPCGHFAALPLVRSTFGLRGFPDFGALRLICGASSPSYRGKNPPGCGGLERCGIIRAWKR